MNENYSELQQKAAISEIQKANKTGITCQTILLIIIALAWLFYRPLLGITLLVVAGLLIWIFAFKGKDKLKELIAKNPKAEE